MRIKHLLLRCTRNVIVFSCCFTLLIIFDVSSKVLIHTVLFQEAFRVQVVEKHNIESSIVSS